NGMQRPLWVVQGFSSPPSRAFLSSPVLADTNGDGVPDVIMGYNAGILRAFSGTNGAQIFEHDNNPSTGNGLEYTNAPAVGHFKPGSAYQLAVVGVTTPSPTTIQSPGRMLMFDLDVSSLPPPWPMFRLNAQNDAVIRTDALPNGFASDNALL